MKKTTTTIHINIPVALKSRLMVYLGNHYGKQRAKSIIVCGAITEYLDKHDNNKG